jgi:hypothetical protein
VKVWAAMLPRLRAEESMLAAERIAVGTGSLKSSVARSIRRGWERQRTGEGAEAARAARATPAALGAIGIGYRVTR